jgi:hypothetical protein
MVDEAIQAYIDIKDMQYERMRPMMKQVWQICQNEIQSLKIAAELGQGDITLE